MSAILKFLPCFHFTVYFISAVSHHLLELFYISNAAISKISYLWWPLSCISTAALYFTISLTHHHFNFNVIIYIVWICLLLYYPLWMFCDSFSTLIFLILSSVIDIYPLLLILPSPFHSNMISLLYMESFFFTWIHYNSIGSSRYPQLISSWYTILPQYLLCSTIRVWLSLTLFCTSWLHQLGSLGFPLFFASWTF